MPTPPRAEQRPHQITTHGDTRDDPYYWLMDRDDPAVIAHLTAENEYRSSELAPLAPLATAIYEEIKARIEETDTSVPVRRGSWWHFERTREGLNYSIACRAPAERGTPPPLVDPTTELPGEEVVLDRNREAGDSDFLAVGVLDVSPDDRWVAVGTDFEGHERHRLTFRPLAGQEPTDEVIEGVYYGFAWANDSRHCFYTTVDDAMRPYRVWRHELGTQPERDELVYQEDDPQFNLTVGRTRDDAMILIALTSTMTTEIRYLPASAPTTPLETVQPRRHGVEYSVEHWRDPNGDGWWLQITNENATDFRLMGRRENEAFWRELIPHRPGVRLDDVDAFARFLAISERRDGTATVSTVPLRRGDDPFGLSLLDRATPITYAVAPNTVRVGPNADFDTAELRVSLTSLSTPRIVADLDMKTGELAVRKQQRVRGGYDESDYRTGRLWVMASDGTRIPVNVVGRRDRFAPGDELRPVEPGPFELYGYGSYEISLDPHFSPLRLPLLDRGIVYAEACVRGGGEMGRGWYESGKLAQKPTTFSDFIAVARALIDEGWTTPKQLAIYGASAGGLLIGAVLTAAPELFGCAVAEVPFVDALTTMLNDTLPLTVGEWEEWGNPAASPTAYRTMKGYSPYDNVRSTNDDGTPRVYPPLYVAGGLNDTRVGFWEPAKWVQRLRDANPDNVVWLKTEMGTGHGGPSGRYDAWKDEAEVLAFMVSHIAPSDG